MKTPSKAFVLAAGLGTRMLPLTRDLPKPMLPIWGTPALERVLRMLHRWGVRDVLINLHHLPGEILHHISRRRPDGMRIQLSFEAEILGTGGALPHAAWFLDENPFWMINSDIVCKLKPGALLRAFKPGKTIASAWLHPTRGPRTVEMRSGLVTNWQSQRPATDGTYTFCGLQWLSPEILRYLPRAGPYSIITAYEKAMADGWKIAGVDVPGMYWSDIGTPAQYLEAHRELGRQRTFSWVDPTADVARGARVRNSVVMAGARLAKDARVENAIVGRGAVVRGHVTYMALRAVQALDESEQTAVRDLGWNLDDAVALPMGPRGSARTFTRVQCAGHSVVLVHYDPSRLENTLYAGHARFLKRLGVRVPSVLLDRPQDCITVFEDLGDRAVQDAVTKMSADAVEKLYFRILDEVLILHRRGAHEARRRRLRLVPHFRPRLYRWEHELFADHFLSRRLGLKPAAVRSIRADLNRVASHLLKAPLVLVHRDLQSSNVLLRGAEPCFIDFQGMRYGPAAYDLASLLCDPYVELSPVLQDRLLSHYAARSGNKKRDSSLFWYAAIQRLAQALGAYARLCESPDTTYFARYITPALAMMRRAVDHVNGVDALRRFVSRSS